MNRRHFIGAMGATAAAGVIAQQPSSSSSSSPTLTRTPLVLMAPRPDGFEAVWAVRELCKGRIEWEADDGSTGTTARDPFGFVPQGDSILRVRVTGLSPGRAYKVRSVTTAASGGREERSEWKSFRTLNPNAATTRFVVWNDTHIHNPTIQKLHEATPPADFLLWNGDTCNDWTSPDLLIPTLLHPAECDITHDRPLFIAWGNHDVRGPHAYKAQDLIATPSGRPFFAFRSGPVAALCLHTGEDKPDDHPSFGGRVAFEPLRREQADWLADTIRQPAFRDAPYRIVFCHIPLRWTTERIPDYSATGFDHFSFRSREAWHQALVDWKTQLIISGHTHSTAYIPPNEQFPYGQVTGGGPQLAAATWMLGEATAENLKLDIRNLEGITRHSITLRPLI